MSPGPTPLPAEKINQDRPDPLPSKKLCNKNPPFNPIQGEDPLGNGLAGKMLYAGSDKEELVKTLQMMLNELGITDNSGTSLGVDGDFAKRTEEAVIKFQKKNKDWELNALTQDGLVGPETSDALNRSMVGRWYKIYQTETDLTKGQTFISVMSDRFENGISISLDDSGSKSSDEGRSIKRRRTDRRAAFEIVPPLKLVAFEIQILDGKLAEFAVPVAFDVDKKRTTTTSRKSRHSVLVLTKPTAQVTLVGTETDSSSH